MEAMIGYVHLQVPYHYIQGMVTILLIIVATCVLQVSYIGNLLKMLMRHQLRHYQSFFLLHPNRFVYPSIFQRQWKEFPCIFVPFLRPFPFHIAYSPLQFYLDLSHDLKFPLSVVQADGGIPLDWDCIPVKLSPPALNPLR